MESGIVLFMGVARRGEFESIRDHGLRCGILIDTNTKARLGDFSGFELVERSPTALPFNVHGMRMLVKAPGRTEAVSYWIRIGSVFTENAWAIRYHIFKQGLAGHAVDGVLVRASRIEEGNATTPGMHYRVQEQFLGDLVRALSPQARHLLLG